ncbi:hypothetical protein O181_011140 [Austropuccinia psidii MF-1]|uniref:Chromo domain-containing protein n=1 Tax=Austropuccinia psidii MF-1 TaxID=1389203 RepID=A0A9Q3BUJ9_9BASI|nr:hypothetical protein [Austropuccinia psidii MF-1]
MVGSFSNLEESQDSCVPPQWKSIHPVFHISLLEPVKTSTIQNGNQEPPTPVIIEEEEEWEVSKILNSKLKTRKLWYLVKWKGFSQDPERSTWQQAENLKNCPELVKDSILYILTSPAQLFKRLTFYGAWWGEELPRVSPTPGMHL